MSAWLATLALYLTMDEINKFLSSNSSTALREDLANKIISQAETKGSEALTKAINAINNVPNIAGSPTVQSQLRDARRKALDNYSRVEKAVNELKTDAQKMANDITRINDQSWIERAFNKTSNDRKVNNIAQQFEQRISADLTADVNKNKDQNSNKEKLNDTTTKKEETKLVGQHRL